MLAALLLGEHRRDVFRDLSCFDDVTRALRSDVANRTAPTSIVGGAALAPHTYDEDPLVSLALHTMERSPRACGSRAVGSAHCEPLTRVLCVREDVAADVRRQERGTRFLVVYRRRERIEQFARAGGVR